MKFGDRGIDVTKAQEFLIQEGFLDDKENYYSIKTLNAVKTLQNQLGVEETGIYTDELRKLYEFKMLTESRKFTTFARVTEKGPTAKVTEKGPTVSTAKKKTTNNKTKKKSTNETKNSTDQAKFDESQVKQKQKIPCYIVNLITNDSSGSGVVYLPHIPEEFSYSKSNNFEDMEIKGRSEPFQGYNNSSALTVDVSVTISADYCTGRNIDVILSKLEALSYPRYSEAGRIIPPKCFFRCATFSVEGVLDNLSITRRLPIIDGKYSIAEVSLSFIETHDTSVSAKTVQGRKSRT